MGDDKIYPIAEKSAELVQEVSLFDLFRVNSRENTRKTVKNVPHHMVGLAEVYEKLTEKISLREKSPEGNISP